MTSIAFAVKKYFSGKSVWFSSREVTRLRAMLIRSEVFYWTAKYFFFTVMKKINNNRVVSLDDSCFSCECLTWLVVDKSTKIFDVDV